MSVNESFENLRRRFQETLMEQVPVHLERLRWDRRRIEAHQQERLRHLLAHAIEHSPFHARRLAGVDPSRFELGELASLPVMTKAEMMESFDEVVTDRRLTRERVGAHLAATGELPASLEERYLAIGSGGSSGLKGMFVYGEDAMADYAARIVALPGPPEPGPRTLAAVSAPSASHAAQITFSLLDGALVRLVPAPVTLPLPQIVERLNDARPDMLMGYPSLLHRLAAEQRAGRLAIAPRRIMAGAEQMSRDVEAEIGAAFGAPVFETYATSEGLIGGRLPGAEAFTLGTDLALVELVDEENCPVPPGTPSARILVTNLFNTAQPLIRYVLEDRLTRRPDAADHGHVVATVEGRSYVTFVYDGARVHSLAVLSPVIETPGIADYRVRQTRDGLDVEIQPDGPFDGTALAAELTRVLRASGLPEPAVSVRTVDGFARDSQTGKLQRLVPLRTPAPAPAAR